MSSPKKALQFLPGLDITLKKRTIKSQTKYDFIVLFLLELQG